MIESEVERFKHLCLSKDERTDELEKQHQEDRFKIIALKEKLQLAERSLIDVGAALELEKTQRERVERRLLVVNTELTHHRSTGKHILYYTMRTYTYLHIYQTLPYHTILYYTILYSTLT